jgi:dynein heavy chain
LLDGKVVKEKIYTLICNKMAQNSKINVLEPTVMALFEPKVGDMTREEAIERIKRYYLLQDLTKLFDEKGFNSNEFILETLDEEKGHLPLFLFDNEDFETRTPSQWVDKTIPIPAKALYIKTNGTIEWKIANIVDYREENNTYLVKWNDIEEKKWLQRSNCLYCKIT